MRERQSAPDTKDSPDVLTPLSARARVRHCQAGSGKKNRGGKPLSTGDEVSDSVAAAAVAVSSDEDTRGEWSARSISALALLTLISTFNYFDRSILSLVLQLIKKEMGLSDTTLGFISSLVAVYAIVGVPVAMLADRWNRRNIVAIGCAFWSVMTLATGFASNVFQLGAARLFMAAGESCGVAPSQSMLSDIFSRKTLPVAIAIFTCASSISMIFYSPIAGWVAQHQGWRMAFIVSGIPGMIVAAAFLFSVKEPQRHAHAREAGIGETIAFLAGSRAFLCILVGAAFMGAYIYGMSAWSTVFLIRVHHLSVQTVGTVISPVRGAISAGGILIGGVLTAWLTRHHEGWRGWIAGIACFLLAPSELVFVFSDKDAVWFTAMLCSSLLAIMHQPAAYSALIAVARPRMRATSISLNLLITTVVGQILGPILIGAANDRLQARFGDIAIRYSLLIAISCCALGATAYFMSGFFMKRDAARASI